MIVCFSRAPGAGDAEIDDLGASNVAVGHDHIVGGDVAMHDAVLVRGFERGGYALLQDSDVRERKRTRTQPLFERRSFHEFHRKIGALKLRIDREHEVAHDRVVREAVKN